MVSASFHSIRGYRYIYTYIYMCVCVAVCVCVCAVCDSVCVCCVFVCVYCMSIMDLGRSTTDMEWFHGKILGKYHIYAFVSSESPVKVLQICSSFTGNSYESTTDM